MIKKIIVIIVILDDNNNRCNHSKNDYNNNKNSNNEPDSLKSSPNLWEATAIPFQPGMTAFLPRTMMAPQPGAGMGGEEKSLGWKWWGYPHHFGHPPLISSWWFP